MKKFSKLVGILMAVCLLGTFVGCDQKLEINLESPKIITEAPEFTGRSVKLTWEPIDSNIKITRQEKDVEDSEEVLVCYSSGREGYYYDRISETNELKKGSAYIYRFYNMDSYSIDGNAETARAITETTITKKYSCSEEEIAIEEDFVEKGETLDPFDEKTFKAKLVEVCGEKHISYSVEDKEADYTVEVYEYNNWHNIYSEFCTTWSGTAKIRVTKTWPENYYWNSAEYEVELEKGFDVEKSDTDDHKGITLAWTDYAAGELDYKITANIKKATMDYTDIVLTPTKITSDEYSNYIAIIPLTELKEKLGLPLGDNVSEWKKATDISLIKFNVSADADGVKHSGSYEYNIPVRYTTYTSVNNVSTYYDYAGQKLNVYVNGYNLNNDKIKIYYKFKDEIKSLTAVTIPATAPDLGDSATYTYTISKPEAGSYEFYVRIEDTYEMQASWQGPQGTKLYEWQNSEYAY